MALATAIADLLASWPDAVLGLPTGRTPIETYASLVELHRCGRADFSRATTFNLDEFAGISASHPGSFRRFMEEHLFQHVNLDRTRVHVLDGAAPDLEAECERFEAAIDAVGGIDLQVLGIGTNGHLGFNEPGEELQARTHRVRLHAVTRRANAALFEGDPSGVPHEAVSMGMGTILRAERLALIATGARKARCIERALRGPVTTRLPASFLQTHRRVELFLDRSAASLL